LQGKDQLIHQLYEQVKIFIQKLQLLEKHISFKNITHFATLLSRPQETINYENYKNMVTHLREEFEERFIDFRSQAKNFEIFSDTFNVDINEMADKFQMELIEVQNNTDLKKHFWQIR